MWETISSIMFAAAPSISTTQTHMELLRWCLHGKRGHGVKVIKTPWTKNDMDALWKRGVVRLAETNKISDVKNQERVLARMRAQTPLNFERHTDVLCCGKLWLMKRAKRKTEDTPLFAGMHQALQRGTPQKSLVAEGVSVKPFLQFCSEIPEEKRVSAMSTTSQTPSKSRTEAEVFWSDPQTPHVHKLAIFLAATCGARCIEIHKLATFALLPKCVCTGDSHTRNLTAEGRGVMDEQAKELIKDIRTKDRGGVPPDRMKAQFGVLQKGVAKKSAEEEQKCTHCKPLIGECTPGEFLALHHHFRCIAEGLLKMRHTEDREKRQKKAPLPITVDETMDKIKEMERTNQWGKLFRKRQGLKDQAIASSSRKKLNPFFNTIIKEWTNKDQTALELTSNEEMVKILDSPTDHVRKFLQACDPTNKALCDAASPIEEVSGVARKAAQGLAHFHMFRAACANVACEQCGRELPINAVAYVSQVLTHNPCDIKAAQSHAWIHIERTEQKSVNVQPNLVQALNQRVHRLEQTTMQHMLKIGG